MLEWIRKEAETDSLYNDLDNGNLYAFKHENKPCGNSLTYIERWLKEINIEFVPSEGVGKFAKAQRK